MNLNNCLRNSSGGFLNVFLFNLLATSFMCLAWAGSHAEINPPDFAIGPELFKARFVVALSKLHCSMNLNIY